MFDNKEIMLVAGMNNVQKTVTFMDTALSGLEASPILLYPVVSGDLSKTPFYTFDPVKNCSIISDDALSIVDYVTSVNGPVSVKNGLVEGKSLGTILAEAKAAVNIIDTDFANRKKGY